MKSENIKLVEEAVRLKEMSQLKLAKELLAKVIEVEPDSKDPLAILGGICYELEEFDEAASLFKRAVYLSPELLAVSLGLLHSLWKLGKRVEALDEVKRFQSISDSDDYREIVKEINEKLV